MKASSGHEKENPHQGLLAAVLALSLSGCLTRRTVTENGRTIESDCMFKRPLKEAVQNSM